MPFLLPNQQRQSTEGMSLNLKSRIKSPSVHQTVFELYSIIIITTVYNHFKSTSDSQYSSYEVEDYFP